MGCFSFFYLSQRNKNANYRWPCVSAGKLHCIPQKSRHSCWQTWAFNNLIMPCPHNHLQVKFFSITLWLSYHWSCIPLYSPKGHKYSNTNHRNVSKYRQIYTSCTVCPQRFVWCKCGLPPMSTRACMQPKIYYHVVCLWFDHMCQQPHVKHVVIRHLSLPW